MILSRKGGWAECWGDNQYGQLGNGSQAQRLPPVDVSDLNAIKQISAGKNHTCALTESGNVKCWGFNLGGQLGNGSRDNISIPVDVRGLTAIKQISVGSSHTCALTESGDVKCWGANVYGQIGVDLGSERFSLRPMELPFRLN